MTKVKGFADALLMKCYKVPTPIDQCQEAMKKALDCLGEKMASP